MLRADGFVGPFRFWRGIRTSRALVFGSSGLGGFHGLGGFPKL